jgi:hypothetical protein
MALTDSYLITTKNLQKFLYAILTAQAPERFSSKFLDQLGFSSSNDRLFIGVLKALGFIDVNLVPSERYFKYLDQSQSKKVLAQGIREAYGDMFLINKKAYEMSLKEIKNKLRTLTEGKKSDKVISLMANTFEALSKEADWEVERTQKPELNIKEEKKTETIESSPIIEKNIKNPQLHYNLQIHLPETRDPAVYDAIFRSLKNHLI